jgi:hypothetical protein
LFTRNFKVSTLRLKLSGWLNQEGYILIGKLQEEMMPLWRLRWCRWSNNGKIGFSETRIVKM